MFKLSAGVGQFNASLAQEWHDNVVSNLVVRKFPTLFVDTSVSYSTTQVVRHPKCVNNTRTCHSSYFPGELNTVSPWVWDLQKNLSLPGDSMIVKSSQGLQVDYWEVDPQEPSWEASDCQTWGDNRAALMLCLSESKVSANTLVAGWFSSHWYWW